MIRRSEENVSLSCENKSNSSSCSCCSSRQSCARRHSAPRHFEYINASHHTLLWARSTIYIIVIFSCIISNFGATIAKGECDPNDPSSCSFGASCQKVMRTRTPSYQCVCPRVNCYSGGLYDPICASDGRAERVYFNPLCLMLDQCAQQRHLQAICNGHCDGKCKASALNMPHEHCPENNAGFCQNGGLCIHHRTMNVSSCRCSDSFNGERCEMKDLPSKSDKGDCNCNKRSEILTIFAIALLVVVLLTIMICLCLRNRKAQDKVWNHCDKDETTPLREDARSESLFATKLAKSTNEK